MSTRSPTGRSPTPMASRIDRRRGSAMALNASVVVAARAMSSTSYAYMGMYQAALAFRALPCAGRGPCGPARAASRVRGVRTDALFDAAGTLRDTYLAVDWAATPLGPTDTWTPTLRTALDILLHSRFPITLMWGPEFV